MTTIRLNENEKISSVALGCMRISGMTVSELSSHVHTALDLGVNFFDHADIYGKGESEVRFGELLLREPGLRNQIFLQDKCGIRPGFYDSSYEHIVESVEKSLKKLNTDYLDALLIHRPDVLAEPEEMAKAFSELKESGKVRYFGVSNHNPLQIETLQEVMKDKLLFNQMQLSIVHTPMIDQGINTNTCFPGAVDKDGGTLEYMKRTHRVLQAWSPFQHGFILGPFIDNPDFPEVNQTLAQMAEKYSATKTAIATAWILRLPLGMQVITGTTNSERLKEIAAGTEIKLSASDWYALYRSAGNDLP